jgi:hypothetical protein
MGEDWDKKKKKREGGFKIYFSGKFVYRKKMHATTP